MSMTTVVNIKTDPYDLYIGRANATYGLAQSKWHNPFKLEREDDRPMLIARYRMWLTGQADLMAALHELHGLRLGCWCKPRLCHGDVLAELAQSAAANRPMAGLPPAVPLTRWTLIACTNCGARQLEGRLCECEGRPIDWDARKARALAWGAACRGLPPLHPRPVYEYRELVQ